MDANVLLVWLTLDPTWSEWSSRQLDEFGQLEGLAINQLILAEVAADFSRAAAAEAALPPDRFARLPLPFEAAFLAGHAFRRYKLQEKGENRSPMPDFYIGAHATVAGLRLLTRHVRRYRTYFPDVQLITPPSA